MSSPRSTPSRLFTSAPTLEEIEALAAYGFSTLPPLFRARIRNLVIQVEEFPDEETEREMELDTPFDLLGLYRGSDPLHLSHGDPPYLPDAILLYRRPILDYWCESGEELGHIVRHVLIHEIGHHFGLSDEDMERIEADSPPAR